MTDNIVDINRYKQAPKEESFDAELDEEILNHGIEILNHQLDICDGFFAFTFQDDIPTASMVIAGNIEPDEAIEALNYAHKIFKEADQEI
jgi:hypothetical protein